LHCQISALEKMQERHDFMTAKINWCLCLKMSFLHTMTKDGINFEKKNNEKISSSELTI